MAADKIVAQPATVTGSIGVLSAKPLTSEMWEELGIDWDEVHTSEKSTMWSGMHDYSEAEWQRFQDLLDRIYEDFTTKVSEGRDLPIERTLEIARGRIWPGSTAKELGLVDELGGFPVALRLAREAAGIAEDADVELRVFPRPRSLWERIREEDPASSEEEVVAALVRRLVEAARPVARLGRQLGLGGPPGILRMPEIQVER